MSFGRVSTLTDQSHDDNRKTDTLLLWFYYDYVW